MKANKKTIRNAIVLTLAAITLVVATVLTTIAYMVSSAKVSNVFTVGNVTLSLLETDVDENGEVIPNAGKTDRNSYHLMPGKTYLKDPTVTIHANSADSVIFLLVNNEIDTIEIKDGNELGKLTMKQQALQNGWRVIKDIDKNQRLYVYTGEKIVDVKDIPTGDDVYAKKSISVKKSATEININVFNNFTIDPEKDQADIFFAESAEVTLSAYAIHAEGTGVVIDENGNITLADTQKLWDFVVDETPHLLDSYRFTPKNNGETSNGQ